MGLRPIDSPRAFFSRSGIRKSHDTPNIACPAAAMTLFAANYDGLRNKGSYDELLARVGSESLDEPDRQAKQLRESPQIANLLDGEGQLSFVEMGKQQLAAATHQQVMQTVLQAASVSGAAPAQHLRAAETQTSGPRMASARTQTAGVVAGDSSTQTPGVKVADAETQAWREQRRSGGTQTDAPAPQGPAMFDLTADDRMEEVRQGLDAEVDHQAQASARKAENLQRTISRHMGEEVGPGVADFAHMMASSSAAAAASPETEHAPKGRPGRPRKVQPSMVDDTPPAPTKNKAEVSPAMNPKAKARTGDPEALEALPSTTVGKVKKALKKDEPGPKPKAKTKAKAKAKERSHEDEFQDLMADLESKPKAKASKASKAAAAEDPDNEPEVVGQSSSSAGRTPGLEKIEGQTRAWWTRQNVGVIKSQAELRGHRFTDLDTKGSKVRKGGKMVGTPKMLKEDYLKVLFDLLKL
jgi:hypothetical protein